MMGEEGPTVWDPAEWEIEHGVPQRVGEGPWEVQRIPWMMRGDPAEQACKACARFPRISPTPRGTLPST